MIEWFDDLALGMRFKSGEVQVTESDIKRFAAEFDPQPFHLDEVAAAKTPLKGLAASGWHTAALSMRLAVEVRPFGPHPLMGKLKSSKSLERWGNALESLLRAFGRVRVDELRTAVRRVDRRDGP